ncbi:MarR family transcriptional regulator [Clostridium sp. C8-1-8]|uniref:MarR family winged helix-turn-helix transcriptional regulator n=1 Tax=Clostridium sp. C8-1-8 TaxID=2698831 RepID=UPI00136B1838|nr:MarR family transcriptional regulator [Clostridium sp. C8-1-8]
MNNNNEMLGAYISQLYRIGSAFISKELAQFNIGYGQFRFLMELYENGSLCQEKLAEMLYIDKGTTARAIKKLEEEGYVLRVRDGADKRMYKVSLTDKAKGIESDIKKVIKNWNEKLTSDLSDEEKKLTLEVMAKICRNQRICAGREKDNG